MNKPALGYLFGFVFLISVTLFANADAQVFADQVTVVPTKGSSQPGCESSGGCFSPNTTTVNVGGKVIFSNTDTAAHTFSSGTPANGPDGKFDSGLAVAGMSFEWNPTKVEEVPYFCLVHPWMTGIVVVQAGITVTPRISLTSSQIGSNTLQIDFVNDSTGKTQEHIDYTATITKSGKIIFGPTPLTHTTSGKENIPLTINESGHYVAMISVEGILFESIQKVVSTKLFFIENSNPQVPQTPNTSEPQPEQEPTCGPGTELVNGICVAIQHNESTNPTDYSLYIIAGIGAIAVVGGGIVISKKKRSVHSPEISIPVSSVSEKQSGKSCNVCGTIIPEGKNVCPSCGDIYSV